jgi:hypothetical protein
LTPRTKELEALSIGPDVRFEEVEELRSHDCGFEKLDVGVLRELNSMPNFFSATSMMSVSVACCSDKMK